MGHDVTQVGSLVRILALDYGLANTNHDILGVWFTGIFIIRNLRDCQVDFFRTQCWIGRSISVQCVEHSFGLFNSVRPTVYTEQMPPVRDLHTEAFLDLFEVAVVFATQAREALIAFRIEVESDRSCYRLQTALLARD